MQIYVECFDAFPHVYMASYIIFASYWTKWYILNVRNEQNTFPLSRIFSIIAHHSQTKTQFPIKYFVFHVDVTFKMFFLVLIVNNLIYPFKWFCSVVWLIWMRICIMLSPTQNRKALFSIKQTLHGKKTLWLHMVNTIKMPLRLEDGRGDNS